MISDTRTRPISLWELRNVRYLAIAYAVSWVLWIGAWVLTGVMSTDDVLFNQDFVWRVLFERDVPGDLLVVSLIALAAVWGPLVAGMLSSRTDPAVRTGDLIAKFRTPIASVNWLVMLGVLALVTVPPLLFSVISLEVASDSPGLGVLVAFLSVFFVFQLITSGTEEVGWRGYLLPRLLPGRGFWEAGWTVGWVWAAWHLPSLLYIFIQQGMVHVQIIGSVAGFTMGIVAMSILHAWFYERTQNVALNIVVHAAFNTVPLTIVLVYPESPAAVAANLLLWGVVLYLRKRESSRAS